MVEYILGIGSLTDEECQEVFNEVGKRKEGMIQAQATITKEVNMLNTIQFQVAQRRRELHDAKIKKKNYCLLCHSELEFKDDTWYCKNQQCQDSEKNYQTGNGKGVKNE